MPERGFRRLELSWQLSDCREECGLQRAIVAALAERAAVQRGCRVNCTWGEPSGQLHEPHDASNKDARQGWG